MNEPEKRCKLKADGGCGRLLTLRCNFSRRNRVRTDQSIHVEISNFCHACKRRRDKARYKSNPVVEPEFNRGWQSPIVREFFSRREVRI